MVVDYLAKLVHEGRHLFTDGGPHLIDDDQSDIQVRISVAGSAADRALHLEGSHPRVALGLGEHATKDLDVGAQLGRQLVEPGGHVLLGQGLRAAHVPDLGHAFTCSHSSPRSSSLSPRRTDTTWSRSSNTAARRRV